MVRPRRDDQETLLAKLAVAIQSRSSLAPWTLAELAPVVGLSPAGLLKRFGSRAGILIALSHSWVDSIPIGAQTSDPGAELRAWVGTRFEVGPEGQLAHGLMNLAEDLADPELQQLLRAGWEKEIAYLRALLEHVELGEGVEARTVAAVLFDALNGTMLRAGSGADASPAHTLETFLEAWT